jgi:hypothetical protein
MERQQTLSYSISRFMFNQIVTTHGNERVALEELFTHLWSSFWREPGMELPDEIHLKEYKNIRRQNNVTAKLSQIGILSFSRGIITLLRTGRALLELARQQINQETFHEQIEELQKNRLNDLKKIERLEESVVISNQRYRDMGLALGRVEESVRQLMRGSIKSL